MMENSCDWRKSTYSGPTGGNCVEAGTWRKSTYSGSQGGNCVEAADDARGVLVRDTVKRDGVTLLIGGAAWKRFTSSLK
jgi:Domain of unknown function (DUF397)